MANEFQVITERADMVAIPHGEYTELQRARFGIEMIGSTLGKYGPDDSVVKAVCKQFGYEYKEDSDAE